MSESALIVRVPEAESCVAALRERFDPSVRLGVPAHITVLAPFMSPELVTTELFDELRGILGKVMSFSFSLNRVGRFAATTYLVPEPEQPFVALTESIGRRFPGFPPFRGEHASIIPHLTVATGHAAEAEIAATELLSVMLAHGPIQASCSSVALLENSSGQWKEMHVFALPR